MGWVQSDWAKATTAWLAMHRRTDNGTMAKITRFDDAVARADYTRDALVEALGRVLNLDSEADSDKAISIVAFLSYPQQTIMLAGLLLIEADLRRDTNA